MTKGRMVAVGAGPGGMAAALAASRVGVEVEILELLRTAIGDQLPSDIVAQLAEIKDPAVTAVSST
jgi:NADPH-dependent 2,4-dienoyl-CoA reductase/sulfur reductase-like enzyme